MTRVAASFTLVAILGVLPYAARATTVTEIHYVMGTYFRVTAEDPDAARARAAMQACFAIAREVDRRFSRFDPDSELSRLNASAAEPRPTVVSEEMAALLRRALRLQVRTSSAFDVSVGALTQLWRTSTGWPTRSSIDAARRTAGAQAFDVIGTMLIRRPGVLLDVDGIAKGWAVDRCAARMRASGVTRALLNLGESSLYAIGAPSGVRGWEVVVRGLDDDAAVGTMTLRDQAVSVSSALSHARHIGSGRVGHIVDPRSGRPLTTPATAVVVASCATDAEAFSKALLLDAVVGGGRTSWTREPTVSTVLITPGRVRRTGGILFHTFKTPRRLAAVVEALP